MKLRASELREQTWEELDFQLQDLKEEYFILRFQRSSGQLEDDNMLKITRRNIARVKTVMREKELEAEDAE